MRAILKMLYSPVILVAVLTFGPFAIPLFDFLNNQSMELSREVGVDFGLCFYALVCVMAFQFGYTLLLSERSGRLAAPVNDESDSKVTARCRKATIIAVVLLLAVGFAILLYTISNSYIEALVQSATTQQANLNIRESSEGFLASTSVPGVIRMFAFSIVGCLILMYALALVVPSWLKGWRMYGVLLVISVIALLTRSLIVLDRNAPGMALLLGVFVLVCRMRLTRKSLIATIVGATLLAVVVINVINIAWSIRAQEKDKYNQVLQYADLGIANASLAYRTTTKFTWGTATLMGPILMVPRGLGIDFKFPESDSAWIWNPASNMLCISIQEFGIFGFIIYFIYGSIIGLVMHKRRKKPHSVLWGVAHIWGLYILLSIWTQPVVASPDLWAAIFLTLFVGWYIDSLMKPARVKASALTNV